MAIAAFALKAKGAKLVRQLVKKLKKFHCREVDLSVLHLGDGRVMHKGVTALDSGLQLPNDGDCTFLSELESPRPETNLNFGKVT